MEQFATYLGLIGIIVLVGILANRIPVPSPLLLVIAGMLLSIIPNLPEVHLQPDLVLDIFLPLLVYETSSITSWRDVKTNIRPIALLSIGHVIFITLIVAYVAHTLIPHLSWPIAFVLGAIVSPPDDVAIVAVAEKIQMPKRILTVLVGEGLLNDATALIFFRFALVAALSHYFSPITAVSAFFAVVIGETAYGLCVGHVIGMIRLKVHDPKIQMMISLLTPFIAYSPAVYLGGSGVLATVVTGLVIGHQYFSRMSPEARLLTRSIWDMVGFSLQSILFLLVGLNFYSTIQAISWMHFNALLWYGMIITLTVIIGRFALVYPAAYLGRLVFPSRNHDPMPPWQYPFVVSWAGMRGGVSLAAAFSIPTLVMTVDNVDMRHFIIFMVFCVIMGTLLLQGLTLPWILTLLGLKNAGLLENEHDRLNELHARLEMTRAVLTWLTNYAALAKDDPHLSDAIKLQLLQYHAYQKRLESLLKHRDDDDGVDKRSEAECALLIAAQIIEVERESLTKLWREDKINHKIRIKLLQLLDLRSRRLNV